MLKLSVFAVLGSVFLLISCSKDDDPTPTPPPAGDPYMAMNAGATRDFERTVNNPPSPPESYRVTTTNRDTVVGSRTYRVFESTGGPNQYFNQSGADYYTFADLGGALQGVLLENLYLSTSQNAGASWNQNFNNITIPGITGTVSGTLTNKIEAKGLTYTVPGFATYDSVIRVSSTVNNITATVEIAPGVPFPVSIPANQIYTNIQSYYAPRVGMVHNTSIISLDIDVMGFQYQDSSNVTTKLTATSIP